MNKDEKQSEDKRAGGTWYPLGLFISLMIFFGAFVGATPNWSGALVGVAFAVICAANIAKQKGWDIKIGGNDKESKK